MPKRGNALRACKSAMSVLPGKGRTMIDEILALTVLCFRLFLLGKKTHPIPGIFVVIVI